MKPFNTLFYFFMGCTLFFCACNSVSNNNELKATDSLLTLPFFNQPDWTPEWINETDTGYNDIHTIPSFSFLDQNGKVIDENLVNGKIYIANFFFTTCPSICPKMTRCFKIIQDSIANMQHVEIVSFSVMPWVDSVNKLKVYGEQNNINPTKWHLLTGDKSIIYALGRASFFADNNKLSDTSSFIHTDKMYLIDNQNRIRGVYNATKVDDIARVLADIKILKKDI